MRERMRIRSMLLEDTTRLAGWLGVVVVLAVLLLTRAEGADERRLQSADGEVKALSQKIAALEARLRVLEGVVQVSGANVKLVSAQGLTIQGGTDVAIRGMTNVAIRGAIVAVRGDSTVTVQGGMLQLNGGGKPIARQGDAVAVDGKTGQITGGSPTILAQ